MSHTIQLLDKKTKLPVPWRDIDEAICDRYDEKPSEGTFYLNWYANIGMLLAAGKSFDSVTITCIKLSNECRDSERSDFIQWARISQFLKTRYIAVAGRT